MDLPSCVRRPVSALVVFVALAAVPVAVRAAGQGASEVSTAAAARQLPAAGTIRYAVKYDGVPFEVGQATHTWKLDNGRYVLRAETETTGMAAMIRHVRIRHVSEGEITESGFRPVSFRVERDGKPRDTARFDWQHNVLLLTSGENRSQADLLEGSQDLLSAFYQIAVAPPVTAIPVFPVTNGRKYYKERVDVLGEERIQTPIGAFRTVRVQIGQPGERRQTLVWMAVDYANLPVRIRFVDDKGGVSEQQAIGLEYAGVRKGETALRALPRLLAGAS